jgi:hypothetical protein
MTCLSRRADYVLAGGGIRLPPAYWRRFRQPAGGELETAYWHRVGQRFYDYGDRLHDELPPAQRVLGVLRDLFFWREDQFFIRLSSDQPLQEFATEPVFLEVLRQIQLLESPAAGEFAPKGSPRS